MSDRLQGSTLRITLLHEMAHAATNGGHGAIWQGEMQRLIGLGAPLQRELRGYLKRTINQRQLIAEMEDAGFEIGDRDQWPSVLRNSGYRHGLVDRNGNIESPAAERLLRKFRSAYLKGVKQNEDLKKGRTGEPIARGDAGAYHRARGPEEWNSRPASQRLAALSR